MTDDANTPGAVRIAETFVSIQGEGKLVGTPSWFVRLSGCNLRCTWCDTPHASWSPEGPQRSIDDLVGEAQRSRVRHAVVTGGEPMMFPQVTELTRRLAEEAGLHITIETAGTIVRPVRCDLMSISPKLANSTPAAGDPRDPSGAWAVRHEQRRLNVEALQGLLDAHPSPGFQLKFVVAGEGGHPGDRIGTREAERMGTVRCAADARGGRGAAAGAHGSRAGGVPFAFVAVLSPAAYRALWAYQGYLTRPDGRRAAQLLRCPAHFRSCRCPLCSPRPHCQPAPHEFALSV